MDKFMSFIENFAEEGKEANKKAATSGGLSRIFWKITAYIDVTMVLLLTAVMESYAKLYTFIKGV